MGLLSRVKGRIKRQVEAVKGVLGAVQEEAKYPGRPQPHMAARNPLWGGEEDAPPAGVEPQADAPAVSSTAGAPAVDPYAEPARGEEEAPGGGQFWFLEGETDGWDETNPGLKPGPGQQKPKKEGDA